MNASQNRTTSPERRKGFSLWKPQFIREWAQLIREEGFKRFIQKKGITLLIAFIAFYAVRDTLLYLVIPYLILKGIITCK